MTARSREQVDKDIARRQAGIRVAPTGSGSGTARKVTPGRTPSVRSTAQVDKDVHIRTMGGKVPARGRLSDAATGRLSHGNRARSGNAIGKAGTKGQKRDRIGRWT